MKLIKMVHSFACLCTRNKTLGVDLIWKVEANTAAAPDEFSLAWSILPLVQYDVNASELPLLTAQGSPPRNCFTVPTFHICHTPFENIWSPFLHQDLPSCNQDKQYFPPLRQNLFF